GHGSHVTAGLYWLPANRPLTPPDPFARLRDYLRWLAARQPVYGIVLPHVFDIDRARDVVAAELAGLGCERRKIRSLARARPVGVFTASWLSRLGASMTIAQS